MADKSKSVTKKSSQRISRNSRDSIFQSSDLSSYSLNRRSSEAANNLNSSSSSISSLTPSIDSNLNTKNTSSNTSSSKRKLSSNLLDLSTTHTGLTKSINSQQPSPTSSSSKINQTNIKPVQFSSNSLNNLANKKKLKNNSNNITTATKGTKRTYSSSSSTSLSSSEILSLGNNTNSNNQIIDSVGEATTSSGSGRSAKSKAIQAISKTLKKTTQQQSDHEIDDQDLESIQKDKYQAAQSNNNLTENNIEKIEESFSNNKKKYKILGKRSKSSGSDSITNKNILSKESEEKIDNIYANRLRKSNSKTSLSSKSIIIQVPNKKAKLESDQLKTFNLTQKEDSDFRQDKKSELSTGAKFSSIFDFSSTSNSPNHNSFNCVSSKLTSINKETGACTSKSLAKTSSSSKNNQSTTSNETNNNNKLTATSSVSKSSKNESTSNLDSSLLSKLKNNNNYSSKSTTIAKMNQDNSKNTKSNTDKSNDSSSASAAVNSAFSASLGDSADSSSENDASLELNRLTDLLQSRGLPNIVNAFGSKVHQFLQRTMSGVTNRSQQLISSLQQSDESIKLTALVELCQLLVMGNEDTLVGFPIKQTVPLLLQCMNSESENFELMNHACRALTYMMESLPRSSSIIADGIAIFLEKLQIIQCMDVAEQSLTALEILSRRHSKQILNATQSGSVNACLTYIDFFSIAAQRNALQIAANCTQNMVKSEFVHLQSSLSILSQRLTNSDKKSVESVCTLFARLVENFQRDPQILKEIASHNVLTNMQHLLVLQPALVSPSIFVTILHTIYLMCSNCNELSIGLLENNIAQTLIFVLLGNNNLSSNNQQNDNNTIEIQSSRTPQELYEIVSIIGEIMPRLPHTGIFIIDEVLKNSSINHQNENIVWQWKDEHEVWRPYTEIDSRIIEAAFIQEEDECVLNTMSRTYVIDFNSMLQINEESGTARPILRKALYNGSNNNVNTNSQSAIKEENNECKNKNEDTIILDNRLDNLKQKPELYANFIKSLFLIVYEVYNSSAGPSIKHRSLRTLLRLIYFSSNLSFDYTSSPSTIKHKNTKSQSNVNNDNNLLYNLLRKLPISSHIASMLASNDPKIIVSALQTAEILMQNLPSIFSIYFHREGVIYQIDKLIESSITTETETNNVNKKSSEQVSDQVSDQRKTRSSNSSAITLTTNLIESKRKTRTLQQTKTETLNINEPVIKNNYKQEGSSSNKTSKSTAFAIKPSTGSLATTSKGCSNLNSTLASHESSNLISNITTISSTSKRKSMSYLSGTSSNSNQNSKQNSINYSLINECKDKVKQWIREQAKLFRDTYFSNDKTMEAQTSNKNKKDTYIDENYNVLNVLDKLKNPIVELDVTSDIINNKITLFEQTDRYLESLKKISSILNDSDISPFEMIHSGLIDKLVKFLSIKDYELTVENNNKANLSPTFFSTISLNQLYVGDINSLIEKENKTLKLKIFLNVFINLPFTFYSSSKLNLDDEYNKNMRPDAKYFSILIAKLHNCINQLEQFSVKVNDVPNSIGLSKAAFKLFTTHQIKCILQPHSSAISTLASTKSVESNLLKRQVKADPFASVSNIEKHIILKGLYKLLQNDKNNNNDKSNNTSSHISSSLPTTSSLTASNIFKTKSTVPACSSSKPPSRSFISKAAEFASDKFKLKKSTTVKHEDNNKLNKKCLQNEKNKTSLNNDKKKQVEKDIKNTSNLNKKEVEKKKRADNYKKNKSSQKTSDTIEHNYTSSKTKTRPRNSKSDSCQPEPPKIKNLDEDDSDDMEEHTNDDFCNKNESDFEDEVNEEENEDIEDFDEDDDEENYEKESSEENTEINSYDDEENFDDDEDEEDDEDDDIESMMSAILGSSSSGGARSNLSQSSKNFFFQLPKIELLINDQVLPSNMTIYKAIKQFSDTTSQTCKSSCGEESTTNTDIEPENESLLDNAIWNRIHVIHYRLAGQKASSDETDKNKTGLKAQTTNSDNKSSDQLTKSKNNNETNITVTEKEEESELCTDKSFKNLFNNLSSKWLLTNNKDKSINSISLLRLLNLINRKWYLLYKDKISYDELALNHNLNQNEFVNTKLTAKANRQLQDPLVIMTGHLPKWLPDLMNSCQFLFPFETRLIYFYVVVFDRDRALQKLIDLNVDLIASSTQPDANSHNERIVPKLDRRKKTINRSGDLIKQADLILNDFAPQSSSSSSSSNQPLLEIQYENEVGTGLGPTLEFYALVSLDIQKCEIEMWRGEKTKLTTVTGENKDELFFYSSSGLYPAPISAYGKQTPKQQTLITKLKSKFKFFGKFAAKAIMDSRVMDVPLSLAFYKYLVDKDSLYDEDLKYVDAQLHQSLVTLRDYLRKRRTILINAYKSAISSNNNNNFKTSNESCLFISKNVEKELEELEKNVSDLDLVFTLPGYDHIELKRNGKDILVTLENLEEYLNLVTEWTLIKGVQIQFESFKEGFETILPLTSLKSFYPEELERLFCGSGFVQWDKKMLAECTRCDHGYTHESKAVQFLFEIMCSFNVEEQRQFLQFVTGSPRLPVGGLRSLTPPLTIVRKSSTDTNIKNGTTAENYLPSVMTCVNYLKLPEYSTVELMKEKLFVAMADGQLSFHLS